MPPTIPNPPKKPANWGRASKTLAFWLVVVLIPVLLLQFTGAGRRDAAKISYTRFTQEVERGNVKEVVVRGGTDVTGVFNTPVNAGSGRAPRRTSPRRCRGTPSPTASSSCSATAA